MGEMATDWIDIVVRYYPGRGFRAMVINQRGVWIWRSERDMPTAEAAFDEANCWSIDNTSVGLS